MQRLLTGRSIRDLAQHSSRRAVGTFTEDGSRRVVVTGLGLVTPLARGVEHTWRKLIREHSGIRKLLPSDLPEVSTSSGLQCARHCMLLEIRHCVPQEHAAVFEQLPCKIAACVPASDPVEATTKQLWKPALSGLLDSRHVIFGLEVTSKPALNSSCGLRKTRCHI